MTHRALLTSTIIIMALISGWSQKDYQIEADTPFTQLFILVTDTNATSIDYGYGSWQEIDSVAISFFDHDFYGYGTGRPAGAGEDSLETAMDSMYILFKGLSGGINHKIEFLKNGTMQFDQDEGISSKTQIIMRTLQQTEGNDPVYLSTSSNPNSTAARQNDQTVWGFNIGGVQQTIDAGDVGFGIAIENNYELLGKFYNELHFVHNDSSGTVRRPFTMFINRAFDWDWEAAFEVPNFYLRPGNTINEDPYFRFEIDTTNHIVYQYFRDPFYLNYGVRHIMDADNAHYTIENNGSASAFFNSSGFLGSSFSGFLKHTSFANNPTALTTYGDADYLGKTTLGWGLDFSGNTLIVDSSQVATQHDLSSLSGTDLTIGGSGPNYTIESSTGTDATIAGGGIVTLSESPANTLVITATEVDGSITNEIDEWLVSASGTPGTGTLGDGDELSFTESAGLDITRSTLDIFFSLDISEYTTDAAVEGDELILVYDPSGTNHELVDVNNLPYLTAEVDGSTTNELNTIEEGNVSVQSSNSTIDFQTLFDVAADGAGEVNVSLDLGEATTVTTVEADDYLIMYDNGSAAHQKMLWTDFIIDLIGFEEDNVNEGSGNTFDFGTGLDLTVTGSEADISLDFNEFTTDAAPEGDEFVVLTDGAGVQEKVAITYFTSGSDTNFAEDDLTFTGNRTHDMDIYSLTLTGAAANVYIQDENGGSGNNLVLVSELGAGTGITGGISFQSENGGTPTEQYDIEANKRSTNQSTLMISGEQNTDAEIIYEKNADLSDNTTESHLAVNGGIAFTQNHDISTSGDLELDRSYYILNVTGGAATDTIHLPEIAQTTDNWSSSLSATQCQVGQIFTITNFRGATNLVVAAYNPTTGTNNADLINTHTASNGPSTVTLAPTDCIRFEAVRLASGIGYWKTFD